LATPETTDADRERFLGSSARVRAIEYRWLARMQSTVPIRALGPPEQVGSLLEAHEAAGIELRLLPNLWPYWRQVIASSLGYSGIRLRNAQPDNTEN
jgi:hypothetical protein